MRVQVQKWSNSLALRIPEPFAGDVGVREGTMVQRADQQDWMRLATPLFLINVL